MISNIFSHSLAELKQGARERERVIQLNLLLNHKNTTINYFNQHLFVVVYVFE